MACLLSQLTKTHELYFPPKKNHEEIRETVVFTFDLHGAELILF